MFIRNVYNLDQNYIFNPPSIHDHKDKTKMVKPVPATFSVRTSPKLILEQLPDVCVVDHGAVGCWSS